VQVKIHRKQGSPYSEKLLSKEKSLPIICIAGRKTILAPCSVVTNSTSLPICQSGTARSQLVDTGINGHCVSSEVRLSLLSRILVRIRDLPTNPSRGKQKYLFGVLDKQNVITTAILIIMSRLQIDELIAY